MNKRPVTLSVDEASEALSTLVYADSVLFNLAGDSQSVGQVRDELLQLRRLLARRFNAAPEQAEGVR